MEPCSRTKKTHSCIRAFADNVSLKRHLLFEGGGGHGLGSRRLGFIVNADIDIVCGKKTICDEGEGDDG